MVEREPGFKSHTVGGDFVSGPRGTGEAPESLKATVLAYLLEYIPHAVATLGLGGAVIALTIPPTN